MDKEENIFMQRLKALRNTKNISQTDIAKSLNITRQAYNNYERGLRSPSIDLICLLAEYFNVTSDYLLGLTEKANSETKKSPLSSEAFVIFNKELSKLDINIEDKRELETALNFLKDNIATLKVLMPVEEKAQVIDFNNIDTETVTVKKIARSKSNSIPNEMTLTKKQQDLLANAKPLSSEDDL